MVGARHVDFEEALVVAPDPDQSGAMDDPLLAAAGGAHRLAVAQVPDQNLHAVGLQFRMRHPGQAAHLMAAAL